MSTIVITGTLRADARCWDDGRGGAVLSVVIEQPGGLPPVHAPWTTGSGNAAYYAVTKTALRLRRGMRVRVHAAGLSINHRMPLDLEAQGVTMVEQLDLQPHHTERAGS